MTTGDWFQSVEIHGYNKEGDRLKHEPIKIRYFKLTYILTKT